MDWLGSFRKAIDYMEERLLQDIGAKEVADAVHISPFYFQKCFKMVTGYSIGEYLRNRRLYLAGLEVLGRGAPGEGKVIDLAYKYGYDTPESFTRAFGRFHGLSPMQLRGQPHRLKVFLPLIVEMKVFEVPAGEWAKFKCVGPMPEALQTVNTRIFNEWLPGNQEFEAAFHINIEWYSGKDTGSEAYESGIWIPVKRLK